MIPILYDSGETLFESNGLGRLRDCISCVVTEERNGEYVCDFEYPVEGILYDKIQLGRIIGVEHDDTNDVQPFGIVSYERPIEGKVTFHCQHISYRLSGIVTSGKDIDSLDDAITMLGNGLPSQPFSFESDFSSNGYLASADGIPRSVRQIMGGMEGSILDTYGGEWEFDKWAAILHKSRGVQRDFSIRYGVNLVDYNETLDYSESFNMAVPFWYDEEEGLVKGDIIDSGEITYTGQNICVPLDLTDKFEAKPTKSDLNDMAESMLSGATLPKQNIEVNFIRLTDTEEYKQFASLQHCQICDTIPVVFPRYNMKGNFKIVKTEYDVLHERFNSMELGDLSTTLSEALGLSDSPEPISISTDTTEPSEILTAGTDISFTAAKYVQRGCVAQLYVAWTSGVAISVPASGNVQDVVIGTLLDGKRPIIETAAVSNGNDGFTNYYVSTTGNIGLSYAHGTGASRTISSGNIRVTYICK